MKIGSRISFQPFIVASQDNFPASDCVIRSETEPNIFYSPDWHECVIANLKFPTDSYSIDYCRPYVWAKSEDTGFGWDKGGLSNCTGDFWPNWENPVRNEDRVVVAFRKVSFEEIEAVFEAKKKIARHGLECQKWDE